MHKRPHRPDYLVPLGVRIEPHLKAGLAALAKDRNCSLTTVVEAALAEHLRVTGYLPPRPDMPDKKPQGWYQRPAPARDNGKVECRP